MMRTGLVILLCVVVTSVLAQESEQRQVAAFRGVKSGEAIDVYLKKGDKEGIKIVVEGARLSDVITEVSGGYLKIHMKDGKYRDHRDVKVYVTYISIDKISCASAANVFSDGVVKSASLDIWAASAATVELTIDAGTVSVEVASAGNVNLEGKAKDLTIEASTAGSVDAYNLESETANVNAVTAGSAKVSVTKAIEAKASSGGSVRYRGNPTKTNTGATSGGSVKKSN